MKYSELLTFNPIEDIIQLKSADDEDKAREYVSTYVMPDSMAEKLDYTIAEQLQIDEIINNKGMFLVGNYGTGKSHLMSVITAVANNADYLSELTNKKFAKSLERIAGKFEVNRIELGGVTMPLREIFFEYVKEDFDKRGINFTLPDFNRVKDNKKVIGDMMAAFAEKYPDKGYLFAVDECLAYLLSRSETDLILDLEFMRALGEMASNSKLRVIFGIQEQIFDNPRFSFVAQHIKHISDRFTQTIITKEDTSYVVSERVLKKTPEQKAYIREHLQNFSNLYTDMASKMEEYVDLFPIHPAYIEVFNKLPIIETRHILKNISLTIKDIINSELNESTPGIISYDDYWNVIKNDVTLKSDPTVSSVVGVSRQLGEIINQSFPKEIYKPLASKIIEALSVHRLTTNDLNLPIGLNARSLKDQLCLYLDMPVKEAEFLESTINTVLKNILTTVSGQFLVYNPDNEQYYIDINKNINFDELIKEKASGLRDDELNRYFYQIALNALNWDKKEHVTGYKIYEQDIIWGSRNIFREGYLFMGLPSEKSTAQPPQDFYIFIMPPFGNKADKSQELEDEVRIYFKPSDEFKDEVARYAAASLLADISGGTEKDIYSNKANESLKSLTKQLSENKNTTFEASYKGVKKTFGDIMNNSKTQNTPLYELIEVVAARLLEGHFDTLYPEYPVFQQTVTRKNMPETIKAAIDYYGGRKLAPGIKMLDSFNLLDKDNIKPQNSKYADYYIKELDKLTKKSVINFSDIFENKDDTLFVDKKFKLWYNFMPIIFLALVYSGFAEIKLKGGKKINASNLDEVLKMNAADFYEFDFITKPQESSLAELKKLFEAIDLNPVLLNNPNNADTAVEKLLSRTKELNDAAILDKKKLSDSNSLWGEGLLNSGAMAKIEQACNDIKNEFSNYNVRYNTPAKLKNFSKSDSEIDDLKENIELLKLIPEYLNFRNELFEIVTYISNIEYTVDETLKDEIDNVKTLFRTKRDEIWDGLSSVDAAEEVKKQLN